MPLRKRIPSLSHGRPRASNPSSSARSDHRPNLNLSSRHTRRLIRQHHTLQKQHAAALAAGNADLASSIARKIDDAGGLEWYQLASRTGQRRERGGDASQVLVEWLRARNIGAPGKGSDGRRSRRGLRMLDVGALTCDTAASRSGVFETIVRIDLKSQEKGILEQDFMARPLPARDEERFDVVSLSLVINYVPEAEARGNMLRRVGKFLKPQTQNNGEDELVSEVMPCLFIVLPAPCVLNSRYLTSERFEDMLKSLGYEVAERKISAKLAYWLCVSNGGMTDAGAKFRKTIVNDGRGRNNFAIVLS